MQGFTPSSLLPATTVWPRTQRFPLGVWTPSEVTRLFFKLSSTPASLTIPTRTSIIALHRNDTILRDSNHTRTQPYTALGCTQKETVSPYFFSPYFLVFFCLGWIGVGGRARHNNSRLALECTELTTLSHKRRSRDGVSVNKTKKLGAVWSGTQGLFVIQLLLSYLFGLASSLCLALSKLVGPPTVVINPSQFRRGRCYFTICVWIPLGAFRWRFVRIKWHFSGSTYCLIIRKYTARWRHEDRGPPHNTLFITIKSMRSKFLQ